MSRTSVDEIREGAVWTGFDYQLQVWVKQGIVQPCGHPSNLGPFCCNARHYSGRQILSIPEREHR